MQLRRLAGLGLSAEQVAAFLADVRIELVLTAHPTEAKRPTVLELHREIYLNLVRLENPIWSPSERRAILDEVSLTLERLWRTGEILLARPRVAAPESAGSAAAAVNPAELRAELGLLRQSLESTGAGRIAAGSVDPVLRTLDVFGFHLARIDVRQNSRTHELAVAQLLAAAGVAGGGDGDDDFSSWDEPRRRAFLDRELETARPFTHARAKLGPDAERAVGALRVLAEHADRYGADGLGSLIVSMTRQPSDLLGVYLLAREAGLAEPAPDGGGLVCRLPVVPLFETLEDLERSPAILAEFLDHPMTRRSLGATAAATGRPPEQQVMVGYSDSNKDGGIRASQWAVHRAQERLAAVGQERGVSVTFFHGRGGTVSRGAGPTDRFLAALPPGTLSGRVRLTEQGETISQKYANRITATYNLKLLTAGVTATALSHRAGDAAAAAAREYEPIMRRLAETSRAAYRRLVDAPGFFAFFRQATPVDVLERSGIGSRPPRRTGVATLDDLRAIPWVFSWSQSRFFLPGWFGVGAALGELRRDDAAAFDALCRELPRWPFPFYVLTNVESMLLAADEGIMRSYADLVEDPAVREPILRQVTEELAAARRMIEAVFGSAPETRRPRLVHSQRWRDEPLRALHARQVWLLRAWRDRQRQAPQQGGAPGAGDDLLPELLLTVNAIASGLRTTG